MLKLSKILLILNTLFWLILAAANSFSDAGAGVPGVLKILLFLEPVLYLLSYYGLLKEIRLLYLFALLLTLGNGVLSITDELGPLDILSLLLSLAAFVSLLSLWSDFMRRDSTTA